MAVKVTNFTTWKAYWQEIADQSQYINGFVLGSADQIQEENSAFNSTNYPVLLVEFPDFKITEKGAENYVQEQSFGIAILQPVEPGDFSTDAAMVEGQMETWLKILARMKEDRRENQLFQYELPKGFEMVKPLFANNMKGYRCEFMMNHQVDLEYNPADWITP